MSDSDPEALFTAAAAGLKRFGLAYVHVLEPLGTTPAYAGAIKAAIGGIPLIVNGGYEFASGTVAVSTGKADAIAYGKLYIANSDLVERFAKGAPLNEPNPKTFYGGGAAGYTDYPRLDDAVAAE
jgi:N-ethylmaleimide reductase